jgi:hypothetical protein
LGSRLVEASGGRWLLWGHFVRLFGCGWERLGSFLQVPCRGPMSGGDVICGEARARLESRDSRLRAGPEPAELALLLGSNQARVKSRDLRLGAGPGPAELDGAPSLFTPG